MTIKNKPCHKAAMCLTLGASSIIAAQAAPVAPMPPKPTVAPAARALLERMGTAYKALKSFSTTISLQTPGAGAPVVTHLAFKAPNYLSSHVMRGTRAITTISNGANLFLAQSADPTHYMKQDAPPSLQMAVMMALRSGAGELGLLPLALGSTSVTDRITAGLSSMSVGQPAVLNGAPVDTLVGAMRSGAGGSGSLSIQIGKQDHLLRRVVLNVPGPQGKMQTVVESFTDVKVNPALPASTFAYMPPRGATLFTPPAEPPQYDPRVKPGAAPIAFTATDLSGQPANLDQYRGKVVLLDFWATWCGPCREEIPNVVAAYKKFHAQGFDVLGISLDQADQRANLTSFMKANNMIWRQVYDGKYWQSAVAHLYGVQAIPFAVLIGKDGKIAAVNVRGEELQPAIQKALAG